VTVPLSLSIGGRTASTGLRLVYEAKAGKKGSAR
jgi:hypothetical protein